MYFVYLLKSNKDESFYTGFSEDVRERLKDHNQFFSPYTSSKAPYDLIWYCAFTDKKKALAFEKYLKSGSGFAFRNKHLA
jgi:predicted GIY-YIG superfamily endonuclease